jgi:hypothetical protein
VTWTGVGGTLDTANNTITLNGINSFSMWTAAASSAPLPIQLAEFIVSTLRANAELKWRTETEVDNYGFEIERRGIGVGSNGATEQRGEETVGNSSLFTIHSSPWSKVGFVRGSETSSSTHQYSYSDKDLSVGRYAYRLKQINQDGTFGYTGSIETVVNPPDAFAMLNNYPNPFNAATTIKYELPKEADVKLIVYDNLGRQVRELVNARQKPGYYTVDFNAQGLSSGMYYYRIVAGSFVKVKKLLLLK